MPDLTGNPAATTFQGMTHVFGSNQNSPPASLVEQRRGEDASTS